MKSEAARRGIAALSKQSGCNIETIRYYERMGLMPRPTRSEGGHRLYGEAQGRRLGFIRRTRELGFTLDEVRTLLRLVDGGRYTCSQVKRITVHHLDEVRGRSRISEKSSACWNGWPPNAMGIPCPSARLSTLSSLQPRRRPLGFSPAGGRNLDTVRSISDTEARRMNSWRVVAVLVLAIWILLGPVAMAFSGCSMGAMCEGPCGTGACAAATPTLSSAPGAVSPVELAPNRQLPANTPTGFEHPPKFLLRSA